jgi:CheY-like chemotaxis protein
MEAATMRILLVDDDEGFRSTLWRLLTQGERAVQVEEAADGQAALQRVATRRPDVVLMYLTMPRMNGVEATRQLKTRWPDLPVIVLTVHDDPIECSKSKRRNGPCADRRPAIASAWFLGPSECSIAP